MKDYCIQQAKPQLAANWLKSHPPPPDKFQCWSGLVTEISQDLFSCISKHILCTIEIHAHFQAI